MTDTTLSRRGKKKKRPRDCGIGKLSRRRSQKKSRGDVFPSLCHRPSSFATIKLNEALFAGRI
jgi:hypothetical protein